MGYVIITRNPGNKKVIAITHGEEGYHEYVAEFETENKATEAAENTTACKAWGYQVVEVN